MEPQIRFALSCSIQAGAAAGAHAEVLLGDVAMRTASPEPGPAQPSPSSTVPPAEVTASPAPGSAPAAWDAKAKAREAKWEVKKCQWKSEPSRSGKGSNVPYNPREESHTGLLGFLSFLGHKSWNH